MKICFSVLVFVILILGLLTPCVNAVDSCIDEESVFISGDFTKGLARLNGLLKNKKSDSEQRLCALHVLAVFYEKEAGDVDRSVQLYTTLKKTVPGEAHFLSGKADEALIRIQELKHRYIQTDKDLFDLKVRSEKAEHTNDYDACIDDLTTILTDVNGYYRTHELYYLIGTSHLKQKQYGRALAAFKKSIAVKPAVAFYLPIKPKLETAEFHHSRFLIKTACTIIIVSLLLCATGLFFYSKPWQWIELKHCILLIGLMIVWFLVFQWSFQWFAEHSGALETLKQDAKTPLPVFIHSGAGSHGSGAATALFKYGLSGGVILFLFVMGIGRRRKRFITFTLSYLFAWIVFGSLITLYYLRYCDGNSFYEAKQGSFFNHVNGNLYFRINDPEPCILTNPKGYIGIEADNVDDPAMREWIKRNCIK